MTSAPITPTRKRAEGQKNSVPVLKNGSWQDDVDVAAAADAASAQLAAQQTAGGAFRRLVSLSALRGECGAAHAPAPLLAPTSLLLTSPCVALGRFRGALVSGHSSACALALALRGGGLFEPPAHRPRGPSHLPHGALLLPTPAVEQCDLPRGGTSLAGWARSCWPASLATVVIPALLLMTGKAKHCGKNKRRIKPANNGARPCNHTGRHERRPRRHRYRG